MATHTPSPSSTSSDSPTTPSTLSTAQIHQRTVQIDLCHREMALEKAELEFERERALLKCALYKAEKQLDWARLEERRHKAEIDVKRQKQEADFDIMQHKVVLEAKRRKDDLELKYEKTPLAQSKSQLGIQIPWIWIQLPKKGWLTDAVIFVVTGILIVVAAFVGLAIFTILTGMAAVRFGDMITFFIGYDGRSGWLMGNA
ncbi:hypothetical protein V495_01262 [Pseudogymnoascus sp. VKM F-4514 (FW-929)]|nr:hypothetical protein V495_01262 [Pseudogymnoascus sp. VKM F-4514 (FW-929)]KFY59613.1 hypothetical protein V497_04169 [Pseudogymnoascus sp. VKM F-4516 (FW-969)]